ncbi:MAG: GxxExxY protein [Proteobacteria bacterium]|nr:GxxExxY protein [Pseudomonadota bacterium]
MNAPLTDTDAIFRLCDTIRETGFAIHRFHRNGHVGKIYQNALLHRLRKQGLAVEAEFPLTVLDEDGTVLGDFRADLFVAQSLVVEVKVVKRLDDEHIAQLLGYLRASRIEHGLLINFGGGKYEIRKFVLQDALKGF